MRTEVQTHSTQGSRSLSAHELLAVGGGLYIVDDGVSAGGGGAWDTGADYGWTGDSGFGTGSGPADYPNTVGATIDLIVSTTIAVGGGMWGTVAAGAYTWGGALIMDNVSTDPNGMISDIQAP